MKQILFALALTTALVGCTKSSSGTAAQPTPPVAEPVAPVAEVAPVPPAPPPAPKEAIATLAPTAKNKVTGTIAFKEVEGGLEVTATVEGLTAGDHAYHVHETGDCSAPDGSSAGGHFNPSKHAHGSPEGAEHHEGDFGNLTAGKDGKATKTFVMAGITLGDAPTSVVGKGFIVHEKKDDFKTQPSGNAGARVACGVITLK